MINDRSNNPRPTLTLKFPIGHSNLAAALEKAKSRDLMIVSFLRRTGGDLDKTSLLLIYSEQKNGKALKEIIHYVSEDLAKDAYNALKKTARRNRGDLCVIDTFNDETKDPEKPHIITTSMRKPETAKHHGKEHPMDGLKRFLAIG